MEIRWWSNNACLCDRKLVAREEDWQGKKNDMDIEMATEILYGQEGLIKLGVG
jgi:hypothetical protein